MLDEPCIVKSTGAGCHLQSLMISVLLLLWTLAACRGLWRGRYVDLNSSLFFWLDLLSVSLSLICWFYWKKQQQQRRINQFALVSGDRGDVEEQGEGFITAESWFRAPLLISASSLFCMNVSCHWKRAIKMVVCISCWVAVALPAFSSPPCYVCFFYSSVRVP